MVDTASACGDLTAAFHSWHGVSSKNISETILFVRKQTLLKNTMIFTVGDMLIFSLVFEPACVFV
jgi:hypothetical protein